MSESPRMVCIRHLEFAPCARGTDADPCYHTGELRAVVLVQNTHTLRMIDDMTKRSRLSGRRHLRVVK
jgi:hypothetical protein